MALLNFAVVITCQLSGLGITCRESSFQGQQGELKQLQRQLHDKETALEEQEAAVKSLTDRLNVLRVELNSSKSAAVNNQRAMEELQVNRDDMPEKCPLYAHLKVLSNSS